MTVCDFQKKIQFLLLKFIFFRSYQVEIFLSLGIISFIDYFFGETCGKKLLKNKHYIIADYLNHSACV